MLGSMPRRWLFALASIALVGCGPRVLLRAHPTLGAIYELRDAEQQRCAGHAPEVFRHVTRWEVTALGDEVTLTIAIEAGLKK